MKKGDIEITSVGEAQKGLNTATNYIGCIAEKRGVDRCILKLINAHDIMFSDEDFADKKTQSFVSNPDDINGDTSSTQKVESSDSPPDDPLAWRNKTFKPCDAKVRDLSKDTLWNWFKDKNSIQDVASKKLIEMEVKFRTEEAKKNNVVDRPNRASGGMGEVDLEEQQLAQDGQ